LTKGSIRRRHFLLLPAAAHPAFAQGAIRVPLRFFTGDEAAIVSAAVARIFPSGAGGPGAEEAGVVIYIDRQLAGPYGKDRYRFTQGPFESGVREQGWQGRETPREIYRRELGRLEGFAALDPAAQDARLKSIETTPFFTLLRQHTIEGMFCDPMHGGNRDFVGWKLIGFPGPYMSWAGEIEAHHGRAHRPAPKSLEQITGRKPRPSEDEA
jgi:gluconate 2-dehydrogenase gamma chain